MLSVPLLQRRHVVFATVLALGFAYEGYALFVEPHGLAGSTARRTRQVGEVARGTAVGQTFLIDAEGLDGVAVRASPAGAAVQGEAVFELSRLVDGAGAASIYRVVRPAGEVVEAGWYWWRFPPLDDSRGSRYRLDISLPNTADGSGLVLEATVDNVYRGGALWVGEREQWGDLVFRTSATGATVYGLLRHVWRDWPGSLGAVSFWTLFVLFNVALAVVIHGLLFERDAA